MVLFWDILTGFGSAGEFIVWVFKRQVTMFSVLLHERSVSGYRGKLIPRINTRILTAVWSHGCVSRLTGEHWFGFLMRSMVSETSARLYRFKDKPWVASVQFAASAHGRLLKLQSSCALLPGSCLMVSFITDVSIDWSCKANANTRYSCDPSRMHTAPV